MRAGGKDPEGCRVQGGGADGPRGDQERRGPGLNAKEERQQEVEDPADSEDWHEIEFWDGPKVKKAALARTRGKSCGPDGVVAEMLQPLDDPAFELLAAYLREEFRGKYR